MFYGRNWAWKRRHQGFEQFRVKTGTGKVLFLLAIVMGSGMLTASTAFTIYKKKFPSSDQSGPMAIPGILRGLQTWALSNPPDPRENPAHQSNNANKTGQNSLQHNDGHRHSSHKSSSQGLCEEYQEHRLNQLQGWHLIGGASSGGFLDQKDWAFFRPSTPSSPRTRFTAYAAGNL